MFGVSVRNVAQAVYNRNPAEILGVFADAKDGICKMPGRQLYAVKDPALVRAILTQEPYTSSTDKTGPNFNKISDALGLGLFTLPNVYHAEMKALMLPAFSWRSMDAVLSVNNCLLRERIEQWDFTQPIDLFDEFKQLGVRVIFHYLFGATIDTGRAMELAALALPVFEGMAKNLLLPSTSARKAAYRRATDRLMKEVVAIIRARRAATNEGQDFLDLLMKNQDPDVGLVLSDEQLQDQVITMIMAGADSTATVLAWAMVELAENQERFEQLRSEVRANVGRGNFTRNTARSLPLLTQFWQEMCGKYPAFPMYFRGVTEELKLGRFTVPANAEIVIIPGPTAPFGLGERQCIGRSFATVTALDVLVHLLQNVSYLHRDGRYGDRRVRFAMTAPPRNSKFWIAPGV